ncbi:UDP-glucose:glycoprotein glucosyltransferase-domain-containing protein [Parasitella parasitica]|nr:UDP-glucose:glycoprotein glucosyltransferase-domain-containing protein [Parasitella parasitica]
MPTPRIYSAILGLIAIRLCNFVSAEASPTVDLTMMAPWSAPNLLIEVAETIATYNESAYLSFMHDFVSLEQHSPSWTPHQTYKEAIKVISALGVDETNFFKLSLAIHEAAPRIEAYNQFYRESVVPEIVQYNAECDVWAQIENQQYCDEAQFIDALSSSQSAAPPTPIEVLPFDHIVYNTASANPTVALYTERFSTKFAQFLDALQQHDVTHVIRYRPDTANVPVPLYLSGYGVEMALKKTDYLVIDDRSSQKVSGIKDKISNAGKKFGQSLFQATQKEAIEPVTPSEIHRLGFKAAQYVSKSNNPLATLNQLVQDFPKYAKSVSELDIDTRFEEEILGNQHNFLRAGMSAVWLNGKGLEFSQLDPFFLTRALRSERKLVAAFEELGFTPKDAIQVMSNPAFTIATQSDKAANVEVFDMRDTLEEPFVIWWNDLEKDKRYSEWTSSLEDYIRPQYPGQLLPVKRNVFNLIMIEDLGQKESIARVVNELHMMIKRLVPVRFGIVSIIKENDSISTIMAQSLSYIIQEHGKGAGMNFLTLVLETIHSEGKSRPALKTISNSFAKTVSSSGKPKSGKKTSFEEALTTQDAYTQASSSFLKRMGITELGAQDGIMFINGKLLEFSEERPWVQVLMPALHEITREIQKMVYMGEFLDEGFDFYEHIMTQPNVVKHRNSFIVPSNSHPLVIQEFPTTKKSDKLKYFQAGDKSKQAGVNLWVSTDLNTAPGLKLASEALLYAQTNPNVRIALIHNPVDAKDKPEITVPIVDHDNQPTMSDLLGTLIFADETLDIEQLSKLIENAIEPMVKQSYGGNSVPEFIIPGSPIIEMEAKAQSDGWKNLADALEKDGLERSLSNIIVNGRVVGPISPGAVFSKENFAALVDLEYSKRIAPVEQAISQVKYAIPASDDLADVLTAISVLIETDKAITSKSIVEENEPSYRHRVYENIPNTKHTRLVIGDPDNSFLQIGFIIDPLSETAQKWVPLINTLATIEGVSVIMHLNPVNDLQELPLKRFYRYVFDSEPHFDPATGVQEIPTAYFSELPTDPLYTLGVETTNAWHVTVREANMDLDNILLNSLSKEEHGVSAVYELENILLEGHCLDSNNKSPPRGLEFEIATPSNHSRKDTLVMANLGYFQLKALPGIWNLGLRDGRSSAIYSIEDIGDKGKWNWDATKESKTTEKAGRALALTSFEGITVLPLVHKNSGMESEDVLESADDRKHGDGLWSSFSSKLFGSKKSRDIVASKSKQADINIFSVASGKLYERFLSIMIASVMKHTQSTVKFWFIENFLSPEFKDFVPHMAKEYGFDYEMVTYKWPSWLRSQREKQRTIWGYKILFLDVLFPLDLDKVIFVDADQIVRTDLKELVDMDLQGAPYGYTPFCSDRTEMDGFRFWSEGYWKSHLRGKPYHISALYVVDLVRFRQLAAGDRLRAQYQQLSADPNSLANLDQDLPNNMQHLVPIFSLPQEWLWCETWCSDESLKTAKTIDLCNNPLTKEPKLDRARRQIPEWETYDNEIDALRKKKLLGNPVVADEHGEQIVISANKKEHLKDEL